MDAWENVVKAALIGTERHPAPPPDAPAAVGRLLARIETAQKESALLCYAGVLAVCQRAGFVPGQGAGAPPTASNEDLFPECSYAAADRLGRILGGEHRIVLCEWLGAVAGAGRRAPRRFLPDLLEAGRIADDVRPFIQSVLGERGRWLAAQNPQWQWGGAGDESVWETGSRDARIALLRSVRSSAPGRAREMLGSTWTQEPPDERVAFVAALEIGLSPADEPFLESVLDDRRKDVRRAAADLLARLPDSALVARMRQRLQPLLSVKASRNSAIIEVSEVAQLDKSMERDGIDSAAPAGFGQRAWWLRQMIGVVPPRLWTVGMLTPAMLVAAARDNDWSAAVQEGWTQAAVRHGDPRWAAPLLSEWISKLAIDHAVRLTPLISGLVGLLAPTEREQVLLSMLSALRGPIHHTPLMILLRASRHPWSEVFSAALVEALKTQLIRYSEGNDYNLRLIVPELGRWMAPAVAPQLVGGWPQQAAAWPHWQATIDQLLSILQFRYEMLQEIGR